MRWERLFEDLEGMLAAGESAERSAELADRTRRERARHGLHDRLVAAAPGPLSLRVAGVGRLTGRVADVGADWVLIGTGGERGALVPFAAIRSLDGLGGRMGPAGAVAKRFPFGAALRAVSRDRAGVVVVDADGQRATGTIDSVGVDLLDLAEHPLDLPRRTEHLVGLRTIPFVAIGAVLRE